MPTARTTTTAQATAQATAQGGTLHTRLLAVAQAGHTVRRATPAETRTDADGTPYLWTVQHGDQPSWAVCPTQDEALALAEHWVQQDQQGADAQETPPCHP